MITTVTGHFKQYDITVETEAQDFTNVKKILFTADADSIDTHNAQRDTHLKSPEFFDSAKYPQLKFEGRKMTKTKNGFELSGDLTIRGITKPLTLEVEFGGVITDPWGQVRAGFTVDGILHRKDFGLTWNAITEAGHVVVSDEIKLHGEIQLIMQEEKVQLKKEELLQETEMT